MPEVPEGDDVFVEAVDGDGEVGKPQGAGGNENEADEDSEIEFKEAIGYPDEDQLPGDGETVVGSEAEKDARVTGSTIVEGNAANVLQSIKLQQVDGRGSSPEIGAAAPDAVGNVEEIEDEEEPIGSLGPEKPEEEIDSAMEDRSNRFRLIDVEEKIENTDDVPGPFEEDEVASEIVPLPKKLDDEAEGDGKEAGDTIDEAKGGHAVLEEGKQAPAVIGEGNEGPTVLVKGEKAAPVIDEARKVSAVLEEGKEQLNQKSSDLGEKSEDGDADVHEKSEDGDADKVHLGEVDSVNAVQTDDLSEKTQHQDESQESKTSGIADASADEEMEAPQGKSPVVPTGLDEKYADGTAKSESKDWQEPQAKLPMDAQNGVSNHSEVTDRGEELKVTKDEHKQDNGKKTSIDKKSAPSELLNKEFNQPEKYDTLSVQNAPVSSDSVYPPRPPPRPAGLGSSASLLEPASRVQQQLRAKGTASQQHVQLMEDPTSSETEEDDETREKLQMIRVKFLRLAHRLGQTPHNVVVAQVLYRLGLAEQLRGSRNASRTGAFSFDRASSMAEQLEAAGQEPLDFSCTIMVIGKTGVGKSATINSIFDEVKFSTDAFGTGTKKVQDIVGMVQGIKVRVIDTPGLLSSCLDLRQNKKILNSVKQFIKKTPPDIVLYLDRLDMQNRDYGDLPLLRTITDIFGPSIWFNAIVVLTHAASAPPDGPNGTPSSYEMFVTQRSHVVQQAIRQAAGDMRLMNPVSLVENHSACRTNRAGQRVLPNGQIWKPHLLLLSFASKILAEANTLLKLQDSPPGKPFGTRARIPPLPFLLSSLLQSRPPLKLPEEHFGGDGTLDDDLDEASESDDEAEYDELPPFKHLTKAQQARLSKEQKRAYFDELDYREKLFMKKQLKEEKRHRKLLKKMAEAAKDFPNDYNDKLEEESGGAASVPVPGPDMPLPNSFDSDNPSHRYRYLDNSNQWLVRPVLETHGWDHDVGYEGVNVERLFVVKDKIPLSLAGQVTKDKKESNLQMELASSIKHDGGKATSFGFDMQTVGKDMAYTLRSEVRFSNFRWNKTAAGLSVNILGDALSAGVKLEDILLLHKRLKLVMTGGAMTSRRDVAYGGTLEATLRDKDHPLGGMPSTLGLSIMDWHGDLAVGCNLQSQLPVGRTTNMIMRANLNNKGAGQVSIRLNSSEQLQIALVALVPIFRNIFKNGLFGGSQPMQ